MTYPTAQDTLDKLKNTFHLSAQTEELCDGFTQFQEAYKAYLSQYSSFTEALVTDQKFDDKSVFAFMNPIFGAVNWVLKKTGICDGTPKAEDILKNSREASKYFGKLLVEDRVKYLTMLQEEVAKREFDIALTISADTGKPIDLSCGTLQADGKYAGGETGKGDEWFNFAREEAKNQLAGEMHGVKTIRKPMGAVNVIGAFNYPYALSIGGIVGGLAAGNGVIISATSKAPGWTLPFMDAVKAANERFSEYAKEQGGNLAKNFEACKDSLVQTTMGSNRYISANADVVHFVGGDETGKAIADAREKNGKSKPILELGGTNVVTVMASALENDADDKKAKYIAQTIYKGFTDATGQRCTAPRILCVQKNDDVSAEKVSHYLMELCGFGELSDGLKRAKIGNPFESGVQMGPLVDETAYQRMKAAIALAEEIGGKPSGILDIGGNQIPHQGMSGHWVNPVAIDWTGVDLEKLRQKNPGKLTEFNVMLKNEIFGPMIHIIHPVRDVAQAVEKANEVDAHHKLATAIFTGKQAEADEYAHGVNATSVGINGAPKDLNPYGHHGHRGQLTIGGDTHFKLYAGDARSIKNFGPALG